MMRSYIIRSVLSVVSLLAFILMLVFNGFATPRSRPEFLQGLYGNNLSTGDISRIYGSKITPASWAFSIWGVIYTWQALWIIYSLSLICRPLIPSVFHWVFHVFFLASCATNCAWIIIWQRMYLTASSIVLFLTAFSLYGLLATSYYQFNKMFSITLPKMDFIAIQALVHNGIAFYATWVTVASLLNMTIAITYVHGVDADIAGTITLIILTVEIIGWFILENTLLEKYLRYTVSQYPVLIVALSAILSKHGFDSSKRNPVMVLVLLVLVLVLFVARLVLVAYRIMKSRNNKAPKDIAFESGYGAM